VGNYHRPKLIDRYRNGRYRQPPARAVAFTVIKPYRPAQVIDSERELDFEAYSFIDTGIQFH
jgi:hypothetical protein